MTRSSMLHFLCAAFFAAFASGCGADRADDRADSASSSDENYDTVELRSPDEAPQLFWARAREGGQLFVMRHGKSPHGQIVAVGMTDGCILGEGRGLSPDGRAEARSLGKKLAQEKVPILKAYTSDMCRSWDTARLVAGDADVIAHPAQKTTSPEMISAFKDDVVAELEANPGTTIALVSHSNVAPLYGATVCDGEDELPEGIISVVTPDSWTTVARIWPDGMVSGCDRTVD